MAATPHVAAQSFNVDFGDGRGTPTSTYGAAAGQVGAWTTIAVTGSAVALKNLDGTASAGRLTLTAQYTNGAATTRTGDQASLLDDNFYSDQPASWSVVITGLANGRYSLYYYAPANDIVDTGAFTANGVSAANLAGGAEGLVQGVDWQVLSGVVVGNGTLTLNETNYPDYAGLAGFQLIGAVPEPSTWALLSVGAVVMGLRLYLRRSSPCRHRPARLLDLHGLGGHRRALDAERRVALADPRSGRCQQPNGAHLDRQAAY